jgi:uncharacterized protein YgiM (DUF1202 family)
MSTSNNTIQDFLKEKFEILKEWLVRYSKIVMPVVLTVCVVITVVTAVGANKRKVEQEEMAVTAEEVETQGSSITVPQVPLEQDAVPGLNEFVQTYYTAMVEGDTDTLSKIVEYMDAKELLKAVEMSKYIESYPTVEVYTKKGPREGTYLTYVYTEVKFYDYDRSVPGMKVLYICTDENGDFYINEDGEEEDNELYYIRELNLQDDAVDLNNRAAAAYNDMLAEDVELATFLLDLNEEIDKNVGEALARAESGEQSGEETAEAAGETAESGEETEESTTVVTKVKAIDVVNIRTSDSETADKIGKAAVGDEFTLLEEKGNGWSKVEYEGREAFIKSDYLEPSETAVDLAENDGDNEIEPEDDDNDSAPAASTETVTVKENVRIRKGASETSEKLATAYTGDRLKVIMKQADGWTKIDYNGQTAYVKSEFVE